MTTNETCLDHSCEFSMRRPVAEWLIARGFSPVIECACLRNCDVIGASFDLKPIKLTYMVAVELKLKKVAQVISQCGNHLHFATETWAAMPLAIAKRNARKFAGTNIGLLGVHDNGEVEYVQRAAFYFNRDLSRWKRPLWRRRNEYVKRIGNLNMLRSAVPS